MIRILCLIIALTGCLLAHAEDGSQLWLRYDKTSVCHVVTNRQSPTIDIAVRELTEYYKGKQVTLMVDDQLPLIDGGFSIENDTITASSDIGLLYGAYELLRLQTTENPSQKKNNQQYLTAVIPPKKTAAGSGLQYAKDI